MVVILSEEMKQIGKEIIEYLDKENITVNSALWKYFPEDNKWKLLIYSPVVKLKGPKFLYSQIQKKLSKYSVKPLSLNDINVLFDDSGIESFTNKGLKRVNKRYINPKGINLIKSGYSEAYIYR
jgi:hypothetical protein